MKKVLISALIISLFFLFVFLIKAYVSVSSGVQIKINEIEIGYKGIITDKFAVRNTKPTHLKIKTETDFIEISPNQKIVELAKIGDSLIKPKNENIVYLKSSNGEVYKLFYTKLSKKTRNNDRFPKEWKEKWMESSEWEK